MASVASNMPAEAVGARLRDGLFSTGICWGYSRLGSVFALARMGGDESTRKVSLITGKRFGALFSKRATYK